MDIGAFDKLANSAPLFSIEVLVQAHDLQDRWRRCNMLANYIAEYVAYQFPEREWAENLISTVTNEFLEAVAHLSPTGAELVLRCTQYDGDLLIEIEHGLSPKLARPYTTFLSQLAGQDIDEVYFGLLTDSDRPAPTFNQFGLVMLVHDFNVNIAARLDEPAGRIRIRVGVPTKEISV